MIRTIVMICLILSITLLIACSEVAIDPSPVPPPPEPSDTYPEGNGEATLTWDAVTTNIEEDTITTEVRYRIYFGDESGSYPWYKEVGTGNIEGDRISYTFRDLAEGNEYFFIVRAYSSGGESSNSNEVSKFIEESPGE
ncbi:MAG: fibronectin type III domain-containing protein [Halanaerobiales bacterium]